MRDRLERKHLRKVAQITLSKKTETPQKISPRDMENLIHELQIHQIELQIQNNELRKAQEETEKS